MRIKDNWLTAALAQETQAGTAPVAQPGAPQGAQQLGQGQAPGEEKSPIQPEPTPTPVQKAMQGKQQMAEMDRIMNVTLPDAARRALPALNQSLYFLTSELASRDDIRLPEPAARSLAVEMMAEWLQASRKGDVSDLAPMIVKSPHIQAVVNSLR